jgi:hypothetical protein
VADGHSEREISRERERERVPKSYWRWQNDKRINEAEEKIAFKERNDEILFGKLKPVISYSFCCSLKLDNRFCFLAFYFSFNFFFIDKKKKKRVLGIFIFRIFLVFVFKTISQTLELQMKSVLLF